ncbi:MAG: hypothetical protein IJ468_07770 [Lachnospiraceae bacterium]|nr:hypothetical protein [Lachnospiraceae bacterium]
MSTEKAIPTWAAQLRCDLEKMAEEVTAALTGWNVSDRVVTPEEFGYTGEGKATAAIQAAVDYAAAQGGATVRLAKGDYVSGTIDMRSNVRLEVAKGARLLGSLDLADYPLRVAKRRTVMDTNMEMHQSLIFAEGCSNISLCGEGIIDGRGSRENFPGDETQGSTPGRPFLIRVIDCADVHICDITLKDSPCWMQNYLNCDRVLIEGIRVENQANFNNDGIDVDSCRTVLIRNCSINSGDDAICFKGAGERMCENVLVENNTCYSSCNAIKIGTDTQGSFRNFLVRNCKIGGISEEMRHVKPVGCDSGITWVMVDGGTVENLLVTNVDIVRARSPFYLRMDDRGRVKPEDPKPPVGTLRNIVFEHITGSDNGPRGSYFLGIPAKSIERVVLHDVHLTQRASQKPVSTEEMFGEMYLVYPDAHMLGDLCELREKKGGEVPVSDEAPAYGLWAKYVKELTMIDYQVTPIGEEKRPEYLMKTEVELN